MGKNGNAKKIRDLNDSFRRNPHKGGGRLALTAGIVAEGDVFVQKCIETVRRFDAFNDGNDSWQEHDVGAFEVDGIRCFFKIEYYNTSMRYHSPDPADAKVTCRTLTIMLADEY
jgi:hypothetical protein